MSEQTFSWVRAFEDGTLTEMQLEALQAMVDNGEAESLPDAAYRLDLEATRRVGEEPGPYAF
jgi:hypothetical protein